MANIYTSAAYEYLSRLGKGLYIYFAQWVKLLYDTTDYRSGIVPLIVLIGGIVIFPFYSVFLLSGALRIEIGKNPPEARDVTLDEEYMFNNFNIAPNNIDNYNFYMKLYLERYAEYQNSPLDPAAKEGLKYAEWRLSKYLPDLPKRNATIEDLVEYCVKFEMANQTDSDGTKWRKTESWKLVLSLAGEKATSGELLKGFEDAIKNRALKINKNDHNNDPKMLALSKYGLITAGIIIAAVSVACPVFGAAVACLAVGSFLVLAGIHLAAKYHDEHKTRQHHQILTSYSAKLKPPSPEATKETPTKDAANNDFDNTKIKANLKQT